MAYYQSGAEVELKSYYALGREGGSRGQEIETILQHGETPSLLKYTKKISWAWWHTSIIPATQEAEAGELLEPRRWRLQ